MTTPQTELDSRFSEPGAEPTSWEQTLAEIKRAELFWISTVRADVFTVRPSNVLAFAKGRFSHTPPSLLTTKPHRRADLGCRRRWTDLQGGGKPQ